jgi:ligand-binding sensor domain-containing protein
MKLSSGYGRHLFLLLLMAIVSCKGQQPTEVPKNNNNSSNPASVILPGTDPYFEASDAITSSYGPTSITRNILLDSKGYIWLATWHGIMGYNGVTFTNFTDKEKLRRFHTFAILEDSKGNIWFATIGAGVYRYDGTSFVNYTTKEGLANDRVTNIYEDKAGNIWFGTEGGASRFDPSAPLRSGGSSFRNYTTNEGLLNNDVNAIIEDKSGRFWFGTRGEACFFDGKTFTAVTNPEGKPFVNVRSIIEDTNGNIWLGGNDGLWRYDGHSFTNIATNFVGYIYEDSKANIWTSSAAENMQTWVLSRYEVPSLTVQASATPIWKQQGMFFGITEDREGGIWLGTLNGVCRYDGTSFNCFREEKSGE